MTKLLFVKKYIKCGKYLSQKYIISIFQLVPQREGRKEGSEGEGWRTQTENRLSCFKLFSVEYSLTALNFLKKAM